MKDAYMIRKDGKLFPVMYHVYFPENDLCRALEAGEWLCDAALTVSVKDYFYVFVAWFIKFVLVVNTWDFDIIYEKFESLHYPVSKAFIDKYQKEIQQVFYLVSNDLFSVLKPLREITDSEFIRERIGGMYETNFEVKDCYFRIGFLDDVWYKVIRTFVEENKLNIETVSVLFDPAVTGFKNSYCYCGNKKCSFLSVNEFLSFDNLSMERS